MFRRSYGFGPVRYATRAAFLAAPVAITVSPATVSLNTGQTQQLTATATNFLGETISVPITWTSPSPSVATVSATGLVTAVGDASVAIAATSGNATGLSTVTAVGELTYLRANIVGGDTTLRAIYSAQTGLTSAGGSVTAWTDARGASGYAPTWTVGGFPTDPDLGVTQGLQVVGTDPNTRYLATGTDRGLTTGFSQVFNQTLARSLVVVASINSPLLTASQTVIYWQGNSAGTNRPFSGFGEQQYDGSEGVIRQSFYDDGGVSAMTYPGQRRGGPKRRVFVSSHTDGYLRMESPPIPSMDDAVFTNSAAPEPQSTPCVLYIPRNCYASIRAILVLNRRPTSADLATLAQWAKDYHGAVNNASVCIMADGDSLTHAGASIDMRKGWFDPLMSEAAYLAVDDTNFGSGGSKIGTYPVNSLESFTSTVARRMEWVIASFANSPALEKILFLLIGTNDISYTGTDAATLASAIFVQVDRFLAANPIHKLILGTIFANGVHDATKNQIRLDTNVLLKSGAAARSGRVFIADYAAITELSTLAATSNATYYLQEGVPLAGTHLTDAGNSLVQAVARTALVTARAA